MLIFISAFITCYYLLFFCFIGRVWVLQLQPNLAETENYGNKRLVEVGRATISICTHHQKIASNLQLRAIHPTLPDCITLNVYYLQKSVHNKNQ